jgi:hypothetical protein
MTIGTPIVPSHVGRRVRVSAMDPKTALSAILAAYLRTLQFTVSGTRGDPATSDEAFKLVDVLEKWPDAAEELEYPSASILVPDTGLVAHSLAPTTIEESLGRYDCPGVLDGSVLWKLGEVDVAMQVDFWLNTTMGRDAVASVLPGAFAPGENARRVMLEGTPRYWDLPARFALEDWIDKDEPGQVYAHERRMQVTIRGTIDVVELRCASVLDPSFRLVLGYDAIE